MTITSFPPSLNVHPQRTSAISRRVLRPSFDFVFALQTEGGREGRALAAPVARLQKRKQAAVTKGLAENVRPSLRDGLRLIRDLPGDRLSCPHHPPAALTANLQA